MKGANVPRWFSIGIIIALIGMALSFYSTFHYLQVQNLGKTDALCNINQTFNCDDIAKSDFSEVGSIPLGVWGIGYFLVQLFFLVFSRIRPKLQKENLQTYALMTFAGIGVCLYLLGVSIFSLKVFCLTCLGVYALCGLQAFNLWRGWDNVPRPFETTKVLSGALSAVLIVVFTLIVYNMNGHTSETRKIPTPAASSSVNDVVETPVNRWSSEAKPIPISKTPYSGLGEDYRWGNDDAKVVLVKFSDFECPGCAGMSQTMKELSDEFKSRVLFVYKNYPLDQSCNPSVTSPMHQYACKVAILARCAGTKGKFHDFYDIAFSHQHELSDQAITNWANQVGLTKEESDHCLADKSIKDKIQDDIALGNEIGVEATPTVFVNGKKFLGRRDMLRSEIERLLDTL